MSMEHEELVKCAICGHEDGFIIWQSLNATLNPEAKADMMESHLRLLVCTCKGDKFPFSFTSTNSLLTHLYCRRRDDEKD